MARLRFGVCHFTHQHYYYNNPRLQCGSCDSDVTIKHLLIDSILHKEERKLLQEKIEKKGDIQPAKPSGTNLGEEAPASSKGHHGILVKS